MIFLNYTFAQNELAFKEELKIFGLFKSVIIPSGV
jgi:hypothetical protein